MGLKKTMNVEHILNTVLHKDWSNHKEVSAKEIAIYLVEFAYKDLNNINQKYDETIGKKIKDSFGMVLSEEHHNRLNSIEKERAKYLKQKVTKEVKSHSSGMRVISEQFMIDDYLVESRYHDVYMTLYPFSEYFLPKPQDSVLINKKRDLYSIPQAQFIRSVIYKFESNLEENKEAYKKIKELAKRSKILINETFNPTKEHIITELQKLGANKQKAEYTATKTIKVIKELLK